MGKNDISITAAIVGVKYHEGAQALIDALQDGAMVLLRREPNNEHDANAIGVWHRRQRLGYLPKDKAAEIAPLMDERIGRNVMDNPMMMARFDKLDGRDVYVMVRFRSRREK